MQLHLKILGYDVPYEEKDLPQKNLKFYKENPRIHTHILELGENPTQEEIGALMKRQEHVKSLRANIETLGCLIEPIIVKGDVVIEGNSRLAAFQLLAAKDAEKWAMIRCKVIPDDTPEDVITAWLGTTHIVGKTPWSPYEQAGYLVRRLETSKKPLPALAKEVGLELSDAKNMVRTYNLMLAQDDAKPEQWSYYFELVKNKTLRDANEDRPHLQLQDRVVCMIQDGKFNNAREIRSIAEIVKAPGEYAEEALEEVLSGDISIEDALELVSDETKFAGVLKRTQKYRVSLEKDIKIILENKNNFELIRDLRAIKVSIDNIFKI